MALYHLIKHQIDARKVHQTDHTKRLDEIFHPPYNPKGEDQLPFGVYHFWGVVGPFMWAESGPLLELLAVTAARKGHYVALPFTRHFEARGDSLGWHKILREYLDYGGCSTFNFEIEEKKNGNKTLYLVSPSFNAMGIWGDDGVTSSGVICAKRKVVHS